MRKLDLSNIEEQSVRENFNRLDEEFQKSPILKGEWKLFDKTYDAAGSYTLRHGLGFKPLDVIVTYYTGAVSWGFSDFTDAVITLTTSGANTRVRFLLGRMT